MSTYAQQLRDPRWQRKRLDVMNRDGFRCVHCKATDKTLHVHHRFYVSGRAAWDYPNDALECVCEECHNEYWVHSVVESVEHLLGSLRCMAPVEDGMESVVYGLVLAIEGGIEKRDETGSRYFENGVCAHHRLTGSELHEVMRRLEDAIRSVISERTFASAES